MGSRHGSSQSGIRIPVHEDAVGLLCVVALLFLVDVLFNWWMIIIIPVVSMVCFALSHWVTTAFVDTDE